MSAAIKCNAGVEVGDKTGLKPKKSSLIIRTSVQLTLSRGIALQHVPVYPATMFGPAEIRP